jgi:hypothetical protein
MIYIIMADSLACLGLTHATAPTQIKHGSRSESIDQKTAFVGVFSVILIAIHT